MNISEFNHYLSLLSRGLEGSITTQSIDWIKKCLDEIPFFSNLVLEGEFLELERITINKNIHGSNKRINQISQLAYPPSKLVKNYGRCNLIGQSVFYASFLNLTAMNEMKPNVGDLVTKSKWKCEEGDTLVYCPIFLNQPEKENHINPRTFEITQLFNQKLREEIPEKDREHVKLLTQFITNEFTKAVNRSEPDRYFISAYFSNKILYDFEDGAIDAIYYPSVQDRLSFENVAIKPTVFDSKYRLASASESIVVSVPNRMDLKKGYFMEGICRTKEIKHSENEIIWNEEFSQPNDRMDKLILDYNLDFR